jgi:hypothetical protein
MLAQSGWQGLLIEGEDILVFAGLRSLSETTSRQCDKKTLPVSLELTRFAG